MTVAAVALVARPAVAQVDPGVSSQVHGWVLSGSTGIVSVSGEAGAAFGAGVAWHFAPRWAVDVTTQWLDRPSGQQAWSFGAATQFRLRAEGRAVPFLRAGAAAYTTTVDTAAGEAPEFYQRRIDADPHSLFRRRHTFTDPAVVLGGGIDLQVSRNVHILPAVEVLTIRHSRRTLVVGAAAVNVSYHFERQPVTPVRAR